MLNRLLLCIVAIFICACASNTANTQNKSAGYLYGEGYADNFEDAKQAAIKDIATSLQVSIKYSQKSTTIQKDNTLDTHGNSNISLESSIKNLPNVEVVQNTKDKDKYKVKVRINKQLLENNILSNLESIEQRMDSISARCNAVSLKNYNKLKTLFKAYKLDNSLYKSLSNNILYGNDTIEKYQAMLDNLPSYKLSIYFDTQSKYNSDIQSIIISELTKFAKITQDSTSAIEVQVSHHGNIELLIKVYDCKDSVIMQIPINTYISINNYNRSRLGPIIYKKLIESMSKDI